MTVSTRARIGIATGAVLTAAAVTGGVLASTDSGSSSKFYWCVSPTGVTKATKALSPPPCNLPNYIISTSVDIEPTTTTSTRPPATTTVPPPPGSTTTVPPPPGPAALQVCGKPAILDGPTSPPAGAVSIPAGDNSATLGGTLIPNTTYWLAPGVHTVGAGQFSQIIPKDGDSFIGAPGAVIDGQRKNAYAFTQHATNVRIAFLTVRGFIAPLDEGVVNHDSGNGWTVERNTITLNSGAALMAGAQNVIRQNCLLANGQYGINAYQGGDGITNLVVDRNEIAGNNTGDWERVRPGCGCTGGAKFWAVNGATVTANYVHDNLSTGLWADTNDRAFTFEGNWISGNTGVGLFYETSYNATIRNNTFSRNAIVLGPTNPGFPTGAIYLSESGGDGRVPGGGTIEIDHNTFVDNWSGVILWENADRFCGSPANTSGGYCTLPTGGPASVATCVQPGIATAPLYSDCRWRTRNVSVHDNTFSLTAANVPGCTAAVGCGFQGVFSNYGTYPAWSPYKGTVVSQAITFDQANVWARNTYRGPWRFMPFDQSRKLTAAQWTAAPYLQDQGSTFTP